MPKDGQGAKIDKAKKILKEWGVPIAGMTTAAIVAVAKILVDKRERDSFNRGDFVFESQRNPKPAKEAFILGRGERLDKIKKILKDWAIPIAGVSVAILLAVANVLGKNKTDKNDRKVLADFLGNTTKKIPKQSLDIMFAHVNKKKFTKEHPGVAYKTGIAKRSKFYYDPLKGGGLIADARELKKCKDKADKFKVDHPRTSKLIGLGEPKERPKRRIANNNWVNHVREYAKEHNLSYRDALKGAGATYKK